MVVLVRGALASLSLIALAGCTLVVDGDPPRACTLGEKRWPSGAAIDAGDGCNRCTCLDGNVLCSRAVCPITPPPATCSYEGRTYVAGERFAVDACNTCLCGEEGDLACTATPCVPAGCTVNGVHLAPGETLEDGGCTWTCGDDGVATSICDPPSCTYEGRTHEVGETFTRMDGATCTCKAAEQVECLPVSPLCTYDGETYRPGEVFAMSDGCNRCRCTETGTLTCTDATCESKVEGWFDLPSVRVAFVVSNMENAASLQSAIVEHVDEFLGPSEGRGLLRILAVTSTGRVPDPACGGPAEGAEDGRFVPVDSGWRFFDPDAPEPVGIAPLVGSLEACHHVEEGIATGLRATSRVLAGDDDPLTPLLGDGNRRFALEGKVAMIFATSGDDATAGDLDAIARDLRAVRDERMQNQLSFHLLVGPPDEPCDSRTAIRYRQLVEKLGGTVEYACTGIVDRSPWVPLGQAAFHYDVRVLLDDVPFDLDGDGEITEPDEIVVFLDGARYPASNLDGTPLWRYDPDAVAVDFLSGHVPLPGSRYEIRIRTAPPDP